MTTTTSLRVLPLMLALLAALPAQALDKSQKDSRSGHGQAADRYLIKNTETVANCGGPVTQQVNPATGTTSMSCRVNGRVVDIEPAPAPKGSGKPGR